MTTFTISLGKKITAKELEKKGFKVGDWAKDILKKVKFKKQEIELVVKTVSKLGLPDGGTLKEIYEKAKEQGLELCPAEVGPALRLVYTDQPKGEWLRIAMEPVTDSDGDLFVFSIEHDDDGLWLFGFNGNPGIFCYGNYRWVFMKKEDKAVKK
jgi:hypothetical protein